jgi:anhydro-N-acetylmuramic acid kinase
MYLLKKMNIWSYEIKHSECYEYSKKWLKQLRMSHFLNGNELLILDKKYGGYLGEIINDFIIKNNIEIKNINAISSHGHTIFHQPKQKLTFQLGCGAVIANKTQLTVINDFRSLDVAFGGQGAPLVPVGDELLFSKYDYCLNLGGIANISFNKNNRRIAGDIGFANMFSNELSNKVGKDFDNMGNMAKSGNLNEDLLNQLNKLEYFSKSFPKSLGIEDFKKWYFPVIDEYQIPIEDKLHTAGHQLCYSIKKIIEINLKDLLKNLKIKFLKLFSSGKIQKLKLKGWVVINSLRGGAAGGGTRMRVGLDQHEVTSLAKTMEVKFTVSGPPIGGAKSGINFDPNDPRKKAVLKRWYASSYSTFKALLWYWR